MILVYFLEMLSSRHIVEVQLKRQVNLDSKGAIEIENQSAIGGI